MTGHGFIRLLCFVCAAGFLFMLDALTLDSNRAFARTVPNLEGAGPRHEANDIRLCSRKALAAVGCGSRCDVDRRCDRAGTFVNAMLHDWARLGLMLANRGQWQGKADVPEDWLTTTAANALPTDSPLAKYGYQIWYSAETRRFMLRGLRGQFVLVEPDLKLVLVQTALSGASPETAELSALWTALRAQLQ